MDDTAYDSYITSIIVSSQTYEKFFDRSFSCFSCTISRIVDNSKHGAGSKTNFPRLIFVCNFHEQSSSRAIQFDFVWSVSRCVVGSKTWLEFPRKIRRETEILEFKFLFVSLSFSSVGFFFFFFFSQWKFRKSARSRFLLPFFPPFSFFLNPLAFFSLRLWLKLLLESQAWWVILLYHRWKYIHDFYHLRRVWFR